LELIEFLFTSKGDSVTTLTRCLVQRLSGKASFEDSTNASIFGRSLQLLGNACEEELPKLLGIFLNGSIQLECPNEGLSVDCPKNCQNPLQVIPEESILVSECFRDKITFVWTLSFLQAWSAVDKLVRPACRHLDLGWYEQGGSN